MDSNTTLSISNVDIREVQKVQLEILLEFDRICKINNIKYCLYAGTLLGAIRHKGFIPWDDDIDVCMLREEYDRFLKVCNRYLDDKYFLQTYKTDKEYHHQFAKLRKNNTLYIEEGLSNLKVHQGIFIDIFPYDNIKLNTITGKIHRNLLNMFRIINSASSKGVSKSVSGYAKMCIYYARKIFPKSMKDKLNTKLACAFNKSKTQHVGELSLATTKTLYERFSLKKSTFYDIIEWEFENYKFPVPREYDYVLTRHYGDYMALPPLEQQKPHHNIVNISLNTSE